MPQTKKVPLRMCLSCRQMKPKRDLIRVVKTADGKIFVDSTSKASGRGAYLCACHECFKKCVKSKALNREFGCTIDEDLLRQIEEKIDERKC